MEFLANPILLSHLDLPFFELPIHILSTFLLGFLSFFLADLLYSLDMTPLFIFRDDKYLLSILSVVFLL